MKPLIFVIALFFSPLALAVSDVAKPIPSGIVAEQSTMPASTDDSSPQLNTSKPEQATVNDLSNRPESPSLVPAMTVLLIMIALLIGGTYLLKKIGVQGNLPGRGFMKIIGVMNLGTREKIALVEIGDTWLVLGITPSNINTLHTFAKGSITLPADQQAVKSFAELLGRLRKPQSSSSS